MNEYGFLSVIPPLLAIFLAFKTKDVILSLFTSVMVGALIAAGGNPYVALVNLWKKYIFAQLTSAWAAELIILMTIIGGFVAILEASGGLEALTRKLSVVIGSRVKVQLAAWI
ncbi:MAG: sodium:proton exchanger, partial [Cloacibacillus sp.]